ncbi:MAG: ABC transporter permease [Candidatus Njordarchaeia archaeon]
MAGLGRYLVRRAVTFVPTLIGVTLLTFIIAFVMPADPARLWAGGERARPDAVEQVRRIYHLNDPWWEAYYFFMTKIIQNKMFSPVTHNPVWNDIMVRFPVTLTIAFLSVLLTAMIGIPLGIIAALRKDTSIDSFVRIFALIGYSTPSFWIAYIFMWIFYLKLQLIPLAGYVLPSRLITGILFIDALILGEWNVFVQIVRRLFLPCFVLAFISAGGLARYVRNSMLDVLTADFIQFAKAKGLPSFHIWRHALKNSLIPIVTVVGFMFGSMLGGALITETVFGINGLGKLYAMAITQFDIPIIIVSTFLMGLIFLLTSLLVDILYALIDPRVRL